MGRPRHGHFVECFFALEKLRDGQRRIFAQGKKEPRKIEPGQVDAIVDAVVIRIVFVSGIVPCLEVMTEQQIQFEMNVRAFAVEAHAGVTHYRNRFAFVHFFSRMNPHDAEVPVQTVVARSIPPVLDYDVAAVVGIPRDGIHMHDPARSDGMNFIGRFALGVALQGPDVHPFVKTGVDQTGRCLDRVAHEAVLPAFPWRGLFSFVIAFYILIKSGAIVAEERVVLRRQSQIQRRFFGLSGQVEHRQNEHRKCPQEHLHATSGGLFLARSGASLFSSIADLPRSIRNGCRFFHRRPAYRFAARGGRGRS